MYLTKSFSLKECIYWGCLKAILPDMLDPAMIPVQPLNMTANTLAKLIMAPVV